VRLEQIYQEVILDHYKHPHHRGLREPFGAQVHHVNPTCGDEVTLRVALSDDGETVTDISYDGQGCSISQAATSMLSEIVVGKTVEDAAAIESEDVTGLIGIPLSPVRLKCALLGLGVLKVALHRHSNTPLPANWPGLDDGITWQ
jgi:nitrogen fixation protein NifU and related proteins